MRSSRKIRSGFDAGGLILFGLNQITFLAVTNSFQSGSGRENTVSSMDNDDSQNRKKPVFDRSQKQVSSPGDGYKKDAVVAGLHKTKSQPSKAVAVWKGAADDMTSAATCPVLIKMHFDKGLGLRLIL